MKEDSFFPSIKKSIENYMFEEEGNITRNKVVAIGTLVLVLSMLMGDELFAKHRSHSSHSSHSSHRSSHGSHGSSHGSHVSGSGSHDNHSSHVSTHGSHSSGHGSHSSGHGSHSSGITDTGTTEMLTTSDVPEIKTPQLNTEVTVDIDVDTVVSIPPKTK